MEVLSYIQSAATILAAVCIYVYLVASVYPWLTMHPAWRKKIPYTDRGVKRVKFPRQGAIRGLFFRRSPRALAVSLPFSGVSRVSRQSRSL